MALFSETNASTVADKSGFSLLAALKAGMGLSSDSKNGLFASLLAETKASIPQVQPVESPSAQPRPEAAEDSAAPVLQSRDGQQEQARAYNEETSRQSPALSEKRKTPNAEEASTKRTETVAQAEREGQDETATASSIEETGARDAAAETAENVVVLKTSEPKREEELDEETLMALLAAYGPLDDSAVSVETTENAEAGMAATEESSDEAQLDMMMAEMAALVAAQRQTMEAKTTDGIARGVKFSEEKKEALLSETETLAGEIAEPLTAQNDNQRFGQALKTADEGQNELLLTDLDSVALAGMPDVGAQKNGETEQTSTLSPSGKKDQTSADLQTFFMHRETVPQAQSLAHAVVVQQSSASSAAGQGVEASGSDNTAAVGKATSTPTTPVGEGGRTVGSYDFASQLSATRTAKGGAAGLPQAIEQVAVQLHKTVKEGKDEMTIQLRPAELGKIEIKLEFSADKRVQGTVVADSQATLNLLQKDSDALQRALQDAGLQADAGCLQFSLRGDGQQNASTQNEAGGRSSGSSSSALLAVSEAEGHEAGATESETYYITPGRVNLRV